MLDTKMENYTEQYTNNKRRQRIEIEMVTYCLACWLHWTPPTSIDHYWTLMHHKTLFKSFNNKNTTTEKNETKNTNTKRKKTIGNNILVGYSLLYTKIENYKEQYTNKRRRQKRNWNGYVLYCMLVTLDTAQFEISLLNADAW